MKPIRLKASILAPLAFASALLLAAFVFGASYVVQEHLTGDLAYRIQAVESHYRATLDERSHKLGAALQVIAADPVLRSALAAHDRNTLLDRAQPIFQRLKSDYNVTHFYFHDAQRVTILRVHQPGLFGDTIDRFTATGAEKSGAFTSGVELGPLGTFTLRAVLPVHAGGKLLGYLELGEEVDQIIQDMQHAFGVQAVVFINKQYLRRKDWAAGMHMLGRNSDWGAYPDKVVVSQTSSQLLQGLHTTLSAPIGNYPSKDIEVVQNGQRYRGRILPLRDAGGRTVGGRVILRDMTAPIQEAGKTITLIAGSALALVAILFGLFYVILGRTENRLTSLRTGIREKEYDLQRLVKSVPDIIYTAATTGEFGATFVSSALTRTLGYTPYEFISDPSAWAASIHAEDRQRVLAQVQSAIAGTDNDFSLDYRMWHKDGKTLRWFKDHAHIERDATGQARMLFGVLTDVTGKRQSEMLSARMGRIMEHSWNEIYAFDADTLRFIEVSDGACRNLGYSMEELRQLTPLDLKPDFTHEQFEALVGPLRRAEKQQVRLEADHLRKDGSRYPVEVRLQLSDAENPPVFVAIIQDISERNRYIEALEYKAFYDALTDLPNRPLLEDRLTQALKVAHRETSSLAVLLVDVLRLREVNDLLGHQNGDLVLKEVAVRLQRVLRDSDTVARLSGDEFAIVLPTANNEEASLTAGKILKQFEQPVLIEDTQLELEAAIGIAQYPDHGDSPGILLQHADIAMRVAKNEALSFCTYDPHDDPFSVRRLKLHGELRQAINNKALAAYYQPKIDIKTGRVTSVEALSRWPHPTEGIISPAEFIPMVEQSGLIRPFTLWILEEAIRQSRQWSEQGIDLTVAVNLSTRNLLDPNLADNIAEFLQTHGVGAERLTLEITESTIMSRPEQALKILTRLDAMGLKLSIDDFGTGYSSLAYLKQLPVAELKIDYSFISGITASESDAVIVHSTIELAHNLGLSVVAEGVEDRETLELLATLGCDTGQGFYFGHPLPTGELEDWLRREPWGQGGGADPEAAELKRG